MKNIIKLAIIVGILLQLVGHPVESKVVGWDWCTEEGHPFWFYGYKFGWPIPVITVEQIWGCLSTPQQWIEFSMFGMIATPVFWSVVFWILTFWPVWKPDCPYYYLCADKEVSKEICGTCKILRMSEAMRK